MYSRKDGRNHNPKRKTFEALRSLRTGVHRFAKEMKVLGWEGLGQGIRDSVAFSTDGWKDLCMYLCTFSTGSLESDKARLRSSPATY